MRSDIFSNFLQLDNQVQTQATTLALVNSVSASGELLVGNGSGPSVLDPSIAVDGQILIRNSAVAQGLSWASTVGLSASGVTPDTYLNGTFTVDINGIVTSALQGNINNITPTTTKGDILVENGSEVVALALGTAGQQLTVDLAEATGIKWVDPAPASSPYNIVEIVDAGMLTNNTVNITLGAYVHNTMFIINSNGNFSTRFIFNLPVITIAEQGVVYRFNSYQADNGNHSWSVVPSGSDVIEYSSHVDSSVPKLNAYQATNYEPAVFVTTTNEYTDAAYGASLAIMAFFPASGTPKWLGINVAAGVRGPSGGGGGLS